MLDLNTIEAHTSKLIFIAGTPYINVHVHYVDERTLMYFSMDIKFKDSQPTVENCLGFEQDEQLQILNLITSRKELFFSMAKEQGILHVQSEEELEFVS